MDKHGRRAMLVYHGSYMTIAKPHPGQSCNNLDFGKGFYVTSFQEQANRWAARKGRITGKTPVVNVYELDIGSLRTPVFDGYTLYWLDFVIKNRTGEQPWHGYDAVYGNIADDDAAFIVNDYTGLLNMGRITENGRRFYLEQLQYSKPNNQYAIASQKGIDAMVFVDSHILEV